MTAQLGNQPSTKVLRCGICGVKPLDGRALVAYNVRAFRFSIPFNGRITRGRVGSGRHLACPDCWSLIGAGDASALADRAVDADRREKRPTDVRYYRAFFPLLVERVQSAKAAS